MHFDPPQNSPQTRDMLSEDVQITTFFPDTSTLEKAADMMLDGDDIVVCQGAADYEIVGKWGARVRRGFSLATPVIGDIACGRSVKVVGIRRNRARIVQPCDGWVSITSSNVKSFVILKKIKDLHKTSETDDALSKLMSKSLSIEGNFGPNMNVRSPTAFKRARGGPFRKKKQRVYFHADTLG